MNKPKVGDKLERSITLTRQMINEETRSVELAFSSEEPYERWFGNEVLDHSADSVELNRLNTKASLLLEHDPSKCIGVVEKAWIDADKKGRAIVRFGKGVLSSEIYQDVLDGIRNLVSVGYRVKEMKLDSASEGGLDTYRVTRWEPVEISLVSVPADATVGVGRSSEPQQAQSLTQPITQMNTDTQTTDAPGTPTIKVEDVRGAELKRMKEIRAIATKHNSLSLADEAIENGMTVEDFRAHVLEKHYGAKPSTPVDPNIGMNEKEQRSYSIVRALSRLANNKPLDGLEAEASQAVAKRVRKDPQGFFIPEDMLRSTVLHRDLAAGSGSGANTVQTTVLGSSMIEVLRAKQLATALGVRNLGGLVGDIAIPRVTAGATTYWLTETEEVNEADATVGQLGLTPKRLAGLTAYSKMLLAQSSIDIESFVREDLMTGLAVARDKALFVGAGSAGEPEGIIAATGVGTVTFGAAASRTKILDFEKEVDDAEALMGSIAWVTSPATKSVWRAKDTATNAGVWLWTDDNQVIGYPAFSSSHLASTNKVIFGNFADAIMADWAGVDVVVDPYTLAQRSVVRIVVTIMCDVGLRHLGSFCISTDSGAQ